VDSFLKDKRRKGENKLFISPSKPNVGTVKLKMTKIYSFTSNAEALLYFERFGTIWNYFSFSSPIPLPTGGVDSITVLPSGTDVMIF
jgi:hypothetical protein